MLLFVIMDTIISFLLRSDCLGPICLTLQKVIKLESCLSSHSGIVICFSQSQSDCIKQNPGYK